MFQKDLSVCCLRTYCGGQKRNLGNETHFFLNFFKEKFSTIPLGPLKDRFLPYNFRNANLRAEHYGRIASLVNRWNHFRSNML